MLDALMKSQQESANKAAVIAQDRQQAINENLMKTMLQTIRDTSAREAAATVEAKATATAAAAEAATSRGDAEKTYPRKPHENRLDPKNFSRIPNFSGGESNYREWALTVERTAEATSPGMRAMITMYMDAKDETPDYPSYSTAIEHAEIRSQELNNIIFMHTEGSANLLIRDCKNGLVAWKKLWMTYNRKTLARTLRMYKDAIMPKVAAHAGEIVARINEWESKLSELIKEEAIELDPMILLATLTEICTPDIKDMIYQQGDDMFKNRDRDGMTESFKTVKEKILSWTSNRVASIASTDIGNFQVEHNYQPSADGFFEGYTEPADINAIQGNCFTCNQPGHIARFCPKGKGKSASKGYHQGGFAGKGSKGNAWGGKGNPWYSKGGGKGDYGKGDYGKGGKGFGGHCFNCGGKGHKATECRNATKPVNEVDQWYQQPEQEWQLVTKGKSTEQQPIQEVTREIGGSFWDVGGVDKYTSKNPWEPARIEIESMQCCPCQPCEDDSNWPSAGQQPKNNKPAPKKISIAKALGQPRVKTWKPTNRIQMIDKVKSQDSQNRLIATVDKLIISEVSKKPKTRKTTLNPIAEEILIAPVEKATPTMCQMKCHVTDSSKFLASVGKMTALGNRVIFDSDRSYIQSKKTGMEMDMIKENGVFKLDVIFMNGEKAERGRIVVDSGAADNVMPSEELLELDMMPKEQGVNFTAANGKPMANHGRKDVQFVPFEFWEAEYGFPFQGRAE